MQRSGGLRVMVAGVLSGVVLFLPMTAFSGEKQTISGEELQRHLEDYQMQVVQRGLPPLPVPLTPELESRLVEEGVLPPEKDKSYAVRRQAREREPLSMEPPSKRWFLQGFIVHGDGVAKAILRSRADDMLFFVEAGGRWEGYRCEGINVAAGEVLVAGASETNLLALLNYHPPAEDAPRPADGAPLVFIDLPEVSPASLMRIYAVLMNRTTLVHPLLPRAVSLQPGKYVSAEEACGLIEEVMTKAGVQLSIVGDKFVKAFPARLAEEEARHPDFFDPSYAPMVAITPVTGRLIMMNFREAPFGQVLQFYREITDMSLEWDDSQLHGNLTLYGQLRHTDAECLFMMDTVFRWYGLQFESVGEGAFVVQQDRYVYRHGPRTGQ